MTARMAVVGRSDADFDALIDRAIERAAGRPLDLTVIAIAHRPFMWAFAPLTGRVSPDQLRRDAHEAAAEAARQALGRLDHDLSARYLAVERRGRLRRLLAAWDLDVVVVADDVHPLRPPRHRAGSAAASQARPHAAAASALASRARNSQ